MGSGTEPQIGGAIAEAILDQLCRQKVFGIVTTHYANLKHYATDADGIVNAAMLYDRGALRPLFQLQVGQPGSSFALEIARKTGLPDEVILLRNPAGRRGECELRPTCTGGIARQTVLG